MNLPPGVLLVSVFIPFEPKDSLRIMNPISESLERSRQACEACRRKKTKCPSERPICSFCERLNIPCVYRPREHTRPPSAVRKVARSRDTKDRVRVLESQVNDLYHALQSVTNRSGEMAHDDIRDGSHSLIGSPNRLVNVSGTRSAASFSLSDPEPSAEALNSLVEVYRSTIHFQPLPLLRLDGLAEYLTHAPRFLRWSFLALTLNFSCHQFYLGKEVEAIELYTRSAEEMASRLAAEGVSNMELTQSLCLLALSYIKAQRVAQAWMATGTAARLEVFRNLTQDQIDDYNSEASSRCYWSVFTLERAFFPQRTSLQDTGNIVDYPPSCPLPFSVLPGSETGCHLDISTSEESVNDLGINAYLIRLMSIWGDIAFYLHETRSGKSEIPWSPDSTHVRLNMRLHGFEAQLPQSHLLRNLLGSRRSCAEIDKSHEYWMPWVMMQVISHSSSAMVNHPFIHLVALKGRTGISQSSNFLQQTVDQALFHSGWVFRLVRTFDDLGFELNNPLIGHLVAATASIPWIFQFAKDQQVSSNAVRDLATCARFLDRVAVNWPSISQKLEALRTLQSVAESDLQTGTDEASTTIRFQPSVFWELLDPKLLQTAQRRHAAREATVSRVESGQGTRMRVATHFVHPLEDDQFEQQVLSDMTATSAFPDVESFEQFPMGELFAHFSTDDIDLLQP